MHGFSQNLMICVTQEDVELITFQGVSVCNCYAFKLLGVLKFSDALQRKSTH